MPSLAAQVFGYLALAGAVAAMATGAAGIFAGRLRSVVIYTAVLQAGYAITGVAAGLLAPQSGGFQAAVLQSLAGGLGVALMWVAARAITREGGDSLPLREDLARPAWCVFCFVLACMSLIGLPPLGGLPAKIAVIRAGLREPGVLFLATIGATALGAVSLWAYAGIALPLVAGPVGKEPPTVRPHLRVLVDLIIAAIILLGLVPYVGFAIAAAVTGAR